MHSRAGSIQIHTILIGGQMTVMNSSDHAVVWGGFLLQTGETVAIHSDQFTVNPGHWRERQKELDLVANVHKRRNEIDGGTTG